MESLKKREYFVSQSKLEMFPLRSLPLSATLPFFFLLFDPEEAVAAAARLANLFHQIPTPPMIQAAVGDEELMRSRVQRVGLRSVRVPFAHISPGASSSS